MFGPSSSRKVRGKGKRTKEHESIIWRADPEDLNTIRNLSIALGGQRTQSFRNPKITGSMNNIISLLLNKALSDEEYITWLESQFPKRIYAQILAQELQ